MLSLESVRQQFGHQSIRAMTRLFIPDPEAGDVMNLEAYASLVELAIEDHSLNPAAAASIADELAHSLCDALNIVSEPNPGKVEQVMLAASLFSYAGFEAKAATLLSLYERPSDRYAVEAPQDHRLVLIGIVGSVYTALVLRSMHELRRLSAKLHALPTVGLTGHPGRYAVAMSYLIDSLYLYCASTSTPRPAANTIRGKVKLVISIAEVVASDELLEVTHRIASAVEALLSTALLAIIDSAKVALPPGAISPFLNGETPVYSLWPGQRASLDAGVLTQGGSFVVSLPTSAGKTLLAELRIAQFANSFPDKLTIYIAPYNALAAQVKRKFDERFSRTPVGISSVWTGAFEIDLELEPPDHILITTPEKLDSIVRRAALGEAGCVDIVNRLGLLIVDEVHMVAAAGRGLALELLLARLRRAYSALPILALSAVAGNAGELGEWLAQSADRAVTSAWSPTRREVLILERNGAIHAPGQVPFLTISEVKDIGRTAADLARRFVQAGAGPVLVFCTQRGYAEGIAERLASPKKTDTKIDGSLAARQLAERIEDRHGSKFAKLVTALKHGVAYHHAGIPQDIKNEIEALARSRDLGVVCSTTTLAEGMHLPFRSVIVPYLSFAGDEYIDAGLLRNVIGRAGRAYSNVRAAVLIVAPPPGGKINFTEHLLPFIDSPGAIRSQLANIKTIPASSGDLSNILRLEDQIVATICDDNGRNSDAFGQAYSRTLAGRTGKAPAELVEIVERTYRQLEDGDDAFVTRNSPLVLTPLGKVAALSGLSARSIRLMRDKIYSLPLSHDWFQQSQWIASRLPDSVLELAATLSVYAYEYIEHCARKKTRTHAVDVERLARLDGPSALTKATTLDRALLYRWYSGLPTDKVVEMESTDVPAAVKKGGESAETWLMDFVSQKQQMHLWILSAGLRLSKLICEERSVPPPPYNAMIGVARFGVPSFRAAALARMGIERGSSLTISDLVEELKPHLRETSLGGRAREVLQFPQARAVLSQGEWHAAVVVLEATSAAPLSGGSGKAN